MTNMEIKKREAELRKLEKKIQKKRDELKELNNQRDKLLKSIKEG